MDLTARLTRLSRRCALAALLLAPTLHAAPVLVVESVGGEATGDLLGEVRRLGAGDVIREREVLRTGPDSRLSLLFASEGLLEMGADARLAIEKLPLAADASDLRSLVSLDRGYLRVLWTPAPDRAARWPFHLFFGGQRSTLQPGEYFFERRPGSLRSCVASGELTVTAIAGDAVEHLPSEACYDLQPADPARRLPRSAANFEAVRREFTTTPSGRLPPPPVVVAAAPAETADAVPVSVSVTMPSPVPAPMPPPATKPAAVAAAKPAVPVAPPVAPTSKPQPLPKPLPPVATAPTGQPAGWTLLLGSYADPGNAEQVVAKLKRAGYSPFTRVKDVDGRTWHSVQVRGLPSREVAEAKATEVRERLRIEPVKVVLLP